MGLDMFFVMKRPEIQESSVLAACGGLIGVGIETEGVEVGYLRKAYSVNDYILELLNVDYEEANCKEYLLTDDIIKSIINEVEFREDENYYEDDWDEDDWKNLNKIMNNIKNNAEKNPGSQFYYIIWH